MVRIERQMVLILVGGTLQAAAGAIIGLSQEELNFRFTLPLLRKK